jgi:hypothetical protein
MRWLPSVKAPVQNVEIGHAHECAEGRPSRGRGSPSHRSAAARNNESFFAILAFETRSPARGKRSSALPMTACASGFLLGCVQGTPSLLENQRRYDNCYAARFSERFRGLPGHPLETRFATAK